MLQSYLLGSANVPCHLCFLRPTRVHNPNGISIGSAAFAGFTSVTDRPIDSNNRPHLRIKYERYGLKSHRQCYKRNFTQFTASSKHPANTWSLSTTWNKRSSTARHTARTSRQTDRQTDSQSLTSSALSSSSESCRPRAAFCSFFLSSASWASVSSKRKPLPLNPLKLVTFRPSYMSPTTTTMGDFIFPLKPSFKLGFKPNFSLKPN